MEQGAPETIRTTSTTGNSQVPSGFYDPVSILLNTRVVNQLADAQQATWDMRGLMTPPLSCWRYPSCRIRDVSFAAGLKSSSLPFCNAEQIIQMRIVVLTCQNILNTCLTVLHRYMERFRLHGWFRGLLNWRTKDGEQV